MRKAPTSWAECAREDLQLIPVLEADGWAPKFSYADRRAERTTVANCPHDEVSFEKGPLRLWKHMDFNSHDIVWTLAEIVDGYFSNHTIVTFEQAKKLELTITKQTDGKDITEAAGA